MADRIYGQIDSFLWFSYGFPMVFPWFCPFFNPHSIPPTVAPTDAVGILLRAKASSFVLGLSASNGRMRRAR